MEQRLKQSEGELAGSIKAEDLIRTQHNVSDEVMRSCRANYNTVLGIDKLLREEHDTKARVPERFQQLIKRVIQAYKEAIKHSLREEAPAKEEKETEEQTKKR